MSFAGSELKSADASLNTKSDIEMSELSQSDDQEIEPKIHLSTSETSEEDEFERFKING